MAKQLNVNLAFTADTSQAKSQLQDLQKTLSSLTASVSQNSDGLGLTKDIVEATNQVAKLQAMLESSKNASGGLDLGKFNQSLSKSGLTLKDYANTLNSLGSTGSQAFAQLAKSIVTAEVPLKRTNALLDEFKTSLANTTRWQLSSSILHGFMGALQSAYGYAQDLNESLNNIRIVTGYNSDKMAEFAEQANKAAKALSTTTTEYTNASLIYYQQGLTDKEVQERTDVTIKMANAAGESATKVSDQLTAVWNNFYDGSKSLEYYADVMTKLGAATASSTDEIAEGLEKFAAIADTVGLSYEYATAALATVTSNTRQSAGVVGTAFKTIFARMQDLELGDTLDDGTTLGTYSEALAKVGINVLDTNGNLVEMDDLLDSIAVKWDNLSKAQQVSLAQSVAGVRQYTQLVALMDNWDAGDADSMMANLGYVSGAEGSLQEQADIYAESWEAARDRVTAAAEEIYNELLNDDFFIALNNGFASFLGVVSNTIDALGGLPGVLTVVSSLMFKMFGSEMATAIDNWGYNIKLRSQEGRDSILKMRQDAIAALKTMYGETTDAGPVTGASSTAFIAQASIADELLVKQQELARNGATLSEEDQRQVQFMMHISEQMGQQAINSAQQLENLQGQTDELETQLNLQIRRTSATKQKKDTAIDNIGSAKQQQIQYAQLDATLSRLRSMKFSNITDLKNELTKIIKVAGDAGQNTDILQRALDGLNKDSSLTTVEQGYNAIEKIITRIGLEADDSFGRLRTSLLQAQIPADQVDEILNNLLNSWTQQGIITEQVADKLRKVGEQAEQTGEKIRKMDPQDPTFGQGIVALGNTLSSVAMSITTIKGMFETWSDEDMSFGDKLLSTFTSLGMVIPMVTNAFGQNNIAILGSVSTSLLAAAGFDITGISAKIAAGGVGALWAALWPIALAAAAVAAALAILVGVIKVLSNAYNADADAAERAAEGAQNLADAYSECKQEYEEMISAMENYQTARDGLDELTKGTEEYNEALKEANRQAQDLINNYGLIEGQDYEWEGQELVIKDESLNRVKAEKEKEVDVAYGASQMAQVEADRAQEKADQTALKRQIRDDNGVGTGDQWWKGAFDLVAGVALDVVSLGASGGLGTMAALTGIARRAGEAAEYDAAIDAAVEEARNNPNLFSSTKENMAETLNLDDQDLIDALWANKDSIQALSDDLEAADRAEKLAAQETANEIMAGKGYENTKSGQGALEAGGGVYQQLYNDAYEEYKNTKMADWLGVGTSEGKAMWSKYAAQQGIFDLNGYEVTNYRKDGSVEYKYIDENGDTQKKTATAEEIAATLAAADAANALEGTLSQLRSELAELSNSANLADHALADFLSEGDLESSTKAEFEQLQADVGYTKDENGNITVDDAKVDELLGLTRDASADLAKAKERGYATAEAYRQAFIDSLDIEWEVPEGLESLDEVLTVGSSDKIRSTYKELGEDGGQAFIEALKIATSGTDWDALDAEQQQAMLNELANIDWSSWEAGDKAIAIAKEYGVAIDGASEAWQNNIDTMRDAANALPDFETLSATLKEIKEISDDIDLGDILSAEDYNTLVAYNSELEKYFAILSDGSAQFIGDKLDFQQAIKESTQADLEKAINAYQDRVGELEAQQKAGLEALGGKDVNSYTDSENYVGDDGENHYSGTNVNTQLNFLESQGYDADQLTKWKEDLADGSTQVSVLEDIASAVDSVADSYNGLGNEINSQQELIQRAKNEIALSAENVDELDSLLRQGVIDVTAYGKAFSVLDQEMTLDGLDAEEVADYAEYLEEINQDLKEHDGMATKVAASIKRLNRGVETLADNWEDWSDILTNSSEESEEFYTALSEAKEAISDITGVSTDYISKDFIVEHMEEISAAANGSEDAIDSLKLALADEVIAKIWLDNSEFITNLDEAKTYYDNVKALMPDLNVGASLDDGEFINALNELILASSMTVPQVNEMLAGMGFSANFASEPQKVQIREPDKVTTHHKIANYSEITMSDGRTTVEWDDITTTTTKPGDVHEGKVDAYAFETSKPGTTVTPKINSVTRTASGSSNNYSSSNSGGDSPGKNSGGGGSSKTKTADKKKESDVLDRYKEITDALDDVARATNKASKAADRLYGKSRIDAMKQANASLQQEISLLKQKKSEAESYLDIDRQALDAAASAAGVSFSYDSEGNISNYTSQMQALLNQYNALVDQVNADGDVSDEEQEQLDTLSDLIDKLKEAISQYDDTRELLQDLDEEITDKFYEWQDNNYEILHYELEIEIELNDLQLEYIDYYLNKIEDDFYSMAEAAQYMTNQIPLMTDSLGDYENFYNKITQAYANGEISQADYVDGMKEAYSSILDQLQALNELDKEMMHYYEDTLDAASEELSKYTDRMEHLTSVLGHYKNLIELINGEYDYESIGKILDGQAKTLKNELDVLTANYKMLLTEKEAIEQSLANAQDDAARELFQEELDAINAAVDEAQENMLAKTEEWAEAQKAIMENAMAEAAAEMEKAFTDGMGFDALSNSLSRLSSYADEYLTKTNQMYETQKLINTAQQAADKSTNEAAKARLKAYTDEIEQLQNKNQLSNLELEIAKAKYDVVLAEIALEEAQNAKSTVRLQRDSEGNFGYVYTSDQEQISQAEQDLADAQNALYNIGLEGANEYGQKLLELKQQLADELVALEEARAAGQYATDEEYYAARDQLIQEYNDLFLAYSEQYTTALGVDTAIQEEAWVNAYENMINKTGDWQEKTQLYTEKCEEAFESWRDVVETESEVVDSILNDLESEVDDVTEASDDLKNEVVNQVIPAMNNQLVSVRNVTSAYAEQRAAIQQLIAYYEQLVQEIYAAIAAQAAMDAATSSSSSSSSIDYSKDYSALMNQAYKDEDWEAYEYYKQMREEKINAGYSDWGVSTDWIDEYLKEHGYQEGASWPDIFNGGFASGGYTGSWGPEGKLTMLHEKELVLNADDTVNFLKGIDIIRSIADSIDLKALQDQVSILPYNPGAQVQSNSDMLEQNVHIEANFPNVQDRNEIQEAFNTLINKASQYANRK